MRHRHGLHRLRRTLRTAITASAIALTAAALTAALTSAPLAAAPLPASAFASTLLTTLASPVLSTADVVHQYVRVCQ